MWSALGRLDARRKEVSGDLEEWAWGHLAGSSEGGCGLEKKASSSHILLPYGELHGCPGKASLRFFLLMVKNVIVPLEGVGVGKGNE